MERLLGHFETLLTGIVANPEQKICALPLLGVASSRTENDVRFKTGPRNIEDAPKAAGSIRWCAANAKGFSVEGT